MESMINRIVPLAAVLVFLGVLIFVRKTNPENKRIRTRTSFSALRRKEICPYCGVKMKKTWAYKDMGVSLDSDIHTVYEREMQPQFECPKCNYKIEAVFTTK